MKRRTYTASIARFVALFDPALPAFRVALVLGAVLALPGSSRAQAPRCLGVSFPASVKLGGQELVLNGLGLREATIFNVDVYVAGLYLERKTGNAEEILRPDRAKRLVLRFVRNVGRREIVDAISEGIRKNAGDKAETAFKRMETVERWLPEFEEGMSLTVTYLPGKGLEVRVNNSVKGLIDDEGFARIFFLVWLGPRPPGQELKRGLLGGPCQG